MTWKTDAFPLSDGADPHRSDGSERRRAASLVEQAKGVLIFRYATDAVTAQRVVERWAAEAGVSIETVAHALVHDISQGSRSQHGDRHFIRWLEDRLRHELPERLDEVASEAVTVAVDHSDSSLDAVLEAARTAARRGVPLEVTLDGASPYDAAGPQRTHLLQRIDLAVELARAVAPGLEVRLPPPNPLVDSSPAEKP
jgi:hypothetical protein